MLNAEASTTTVLRLFHRRYVAHEVRVPRLQDTGSAHQAWGVMVDHAAGADCVVIPSHHPLLRRRTTAATNKVESYNNFSSWCRFGNEGRVRDNDPPEQEKQIKFSTLLTNAVIFHTTLDMMSVLRQLAADGREIKPEDQAVLSPYPTMRINRFGVYATDEITITPEQYDAHLPDIDLTISEPVPSPAR